MNDLSSRKIFLSSLSVLGMSSLVGCGNGALLGAKAGRSGPELACEPNIGCPTPAPSYENTGGINPTAWQKFESWAGANGVKISDGYNSGAWLVAHGGNTSSGGLLYSGSTTVSSGSGQYAGTLVVNKSNIPGNPTVSATVPQQVPTNGSCQTSVGTLDTTDQSAYGTITFVVQGTPCSLTLTQTDSSGVKFNYAYKNLNTGFVVNFPVTIPSTTPGQIQAALVGRIHPDINRAVCYSIEAFGLSLALLAAILCVVALPEAIAGAAYAATMGATMNGATWASITLGAIHALGCQ